MVQLMLEVQSRQLRGQAMQLPFLARYPAEGHEARQLVLSRKYVGMQVEQVKAEERQVEQG